MSVRNTGRTIGFALAQQPSTLNALGDSIYGGQSFYAVYNSPAYAAQVAAIPAWVTGKIIAVGTLCKNAGIVFHCTIAGTTGTTAPTGTGTISDGGVTWAYVQTLNVVKSGTSGLFWAEAFALGRVRWDMTLGYGGIYGAVLKCLVVTPGANYASSDTVSFGFGATGTLVVNAAGAITGVAITNSGFSNGLTFVPTIATSTGTGAVLSVVQGGSGTFGVSGCYTRDMIARLPDVLAAGLGYCVVHGGTNDVKADLAATTIIGNLQTCYEALMAAGVRVIAEPITPFAPNQTASRLATAHRVNAWIRAYCRGETWANPNGFTAIALSDPTGYLVDGTQGTNYPIGGNGGVVGAVTQDGLHPSHRGAFYKGYCLWQALQRWIGPPQSYASRSYSLDDGYDRVLNPSGNMMEGYPWQANTAYAVGQQCANGSNLYRVTTSGTSAASGGPTGTSTSTDGTVGWTWMNTAKMTVSASGGTAAPTAATGITFSSSVIPAGTKFFRTSGSATGTIGCSIESPWSNGQVGQRQVFTYSLGGGTTSERWDYALVFGSHVADWNIQAADVGATPYVIYMEIEVTNAALLQRLQLIWSDIYGISVGPYISGPGYELPATTGDQVAWPNGGKLQLESPPFIVPFDFVHFNFLFTTVFNASGAAGSAFATIKINRFGLRKYGVA